MQRRLLRAGWLVAAATLVLTSGSRAQGTGRWAGKIDTLANHAVHVSNPATALWTPATAWRLTQDLKIGTVEADGPDLFGRIGPIEVDQGGRIYVAERQALEVRVFDARGRYVRTLGRKGRGPGEFQDVSGLGFDRAGRLWVVDQQNNRYSVFDTSGALVMDHPRPYVGIRTYAWWGAIDTAGRVIEYGQAGADKRGWLGLNSSFGVIDTFLAPVGPKEEYYTVKTANSQTFFGVPFTVSLVSVLDPRRFLFLGTTKPYRIYQRSLRGDTLRVIEKPYEPVRVSAEERDSVHQRFGKTYPGAVIDESRIPSEKPAFAALFVSDDGYLFVRPYATGRQPGEALDVFDPAGRFLGTIASPVKTTSTIVRGGVLYGVYSDESDVNYVVRLRVIKP